MKKTCALLMLIMVSLHFSSCKKDKADSINYEGLINYLSGDVKVAADGMTFDAKVGDSIRQGMTIKTGDKSVVDIYFNENVIRILEKSTVVISELVRSISTGKENTEFYVENGKMFSKVAKKLTDGEKFRVSTPTSVAGVRGTEFLVEEENGKSTVSCIEGVVIVKEAGSDDSTFEEVEAGKEANLEKGKPVNIAELKEKNSENIRKIKDDIKVIREDIRKKFEEQKEEIKQKIQEQKEADQKMVNDLKENNKESVDAIKEATQINKDEVKPDINAKKEEQSEKIKNVKPEIKKFKTDLK